MGTIGSDGNNRIRWDQYDQEGAIASDGNYRIR